MKNFSYLFISLIILTSIIVGAKPSGKILLAKMDEEKAWEKQRQDLYKNPSPTETSYGRMYCDNQKKCFIIINERS